MASYEYKVKIGAESDIAKVVNADLKKAMSDAKSNKIKLEFDVASTVGMEIVYEEVRSCSCRG